MIKACTLCKQDKELSEYPSRGGSQAHLLKSRCKTCLFREHKRWAEDNPERIRKYRSKNSWTLAKRCARRGITPEQLLDTYERQEECCAICKSHIELSDSAIDHNHATQEFRGVLCKQCNRALGMFGDSINTLKNAVEYLEVYGSYGNAT